MTEVPLQFVPYDERFLEPSWKWLNDPEIKKLTLTPDFTKEGQLKWFALLPEKTDYLIWGIFWDNAPVGAVGLKNITSSEGEYWGYIGEKSYWGRGIGRIMVDFIIRAAREKELERLYLKVADYNERAIALYRKLGFEEEKRDEEGVIIMEKMISL